MPRFFVENIAEKKATITGEDAKHIVKSLRMTTGEKLVICDNKGYDYECVIDKLGDAVELSILSREKNQSEPNANVVLFQAMPKSDKMDFIIQKAVELGVNQIVPVLTSRCVSRPDKKSMSKKTERYQKIAVEAAKQCGRGKIPVVDNIIDYTECLSKMQKFEKSMLFYELGGRRIDEIITQDMKDIAILVGSEGGFEQSEVELAVQKNIAVATLGKRILRCETAPLCSLSIIMNITGDI
ncbi:MAG: hypothetical protein K0R90_1835 [Oscillospiraceae bacterium]|jgi:16S rRNA (uracil1498-N3)-methyltransferase|nr:hypothetical protein [Oscillospiraceae bacterium]